MNTYHFSAALTLGLAVTQTAPGAQSNLPTAGSVSARFVITEPARQLAVCAPQVGSHLFESPNAIKVGASSDREWIASLNLCARRF
jgi:hypothetical protein